MKPISTPPTHSSFSRLARRVWFSSTQISDELLTSDSKAKQLGLVYGIYRILIGVFLVLTHYSGHEALKIYLPPASSFLVGDIEHLFVGLYLLFAVIFVGVLYIWQSQIRHQLFFGFVVDIVVLTFLLFGGTAKDLQVALLYMVTVAASFMILKLSHASFITLAAILSLIMQQVIYAYLGRIGFLSISDTAMLSASLVATGFVSWSIAQRLTIAETIANNRAKEIIRLNTINKEVIQNIVNGVIVIGRNGRLLIINQIAQQMLRLRIRDNIHSNAYTFEAQQQIAKHYKAFTDWYQYDSTSHSFYLSLPQYNNLPAKNIRIFKKELPEYGQLLILEDASREESFAQQLKLASLGQLSASIAHEIRNPLGAISQASQLLNEELDSHDYNYELCQIIYNQTQRVNRIIEDVMRLSRQETPKQELIHLTTWLPEFLLRYYGDKNIATHFDSEGYIFFDSQHLEQIFINLINNALRHTKTIKGQPDVQIRVHSDGYILIDVLDNGDGVSETDLDSLFNPFFTKSVGGTGLGLYLSKAFSEANHAHLLYIPNHKKSCFRLVAPIYDSS